MSAAPDLNALMVEHSISVWLDPDWWPSSGLPRWLAGKDIHAVEGEYYSTLTGRGSGSIEAEFTVAGNTPLAAVLGCIDKAAGSAS